VLSYEYFAQSLSIARKIYPCQEGIFIIFCYFVYVNTAHGRHVIVNMALLYVNGSIVHTMPDFQTIS